MQGRAGRCTQLPFVTSSRGFEGITPDIHDKQVLRVRAIWPYHTKNPCDDRLFVKDEYFSF